MASTQATDEPLLWSDEGGVQEGATLDADAQSRQCASRLGALCEGSCCPMGVLRTRCARWCGELLRQRGFVVEDSVLTLTVTPDDGAAATHRVRVVRARSSFSSSSVGAS